LAWKELLVWFSQKKRSHPSRNSPLQ
jgi:hypothetical protein